MNGVSSTLKEEIKKSKDFKKKEKFKFIGVIICTNLLVAILCMPSSQDKTTPKKVSRTLHSNHQMMVIPLHAMVSNTHEKNLETPVSLISKDKKIISIKAYLHEEVKSTEETTQFKIEIINTDVLKVSQATVFGVIAIPYVKNKETVHIKRGSKYEISL